jgi:hypothetical protein
MGDLAVKESGLIADINLDELGIELSSAMNIQASFMPTFEEYKGYQEMYALIIKSEITPELCEQAKALKNKLVKVRTSIDRIHKSEKAYYLAASKFIDSLKNKLQEPGKLMEDNLKEIYEFYERQEEERLAKLQTERQELLSAYVDDAQDRDLKSMDEDVW